MVELIETKRAKAPDTASKTKRPMRPTELTPSAAASLEIREEWSQRFVTWFLSMTGGDVQPDGVPVGHRWRMEYFECVRDPRAFEQYAENEIRAYAGGT